MTHPAYALADQLLSLLSPACVRIEIAGSLRRGKENPHDIELVARPIVGVFEIKDMFGFVTDRILDDKLDQSLLHLYADGVWGLDDHTKRNGANYKRLKHSESGICCDLFIVTDPAKWGIIYTIRTGSGDFSRDLVTLARKRGGFVQHGLLHQHTPKVNELGEVQECPNGQACSKIVPTPNESDFFEALGLPWIDPKYRTTLVEALAKQGVKA